MVQFTRRKLLIGAGIAAALPTGWLAVHATKWRSSIIVDHLRERLPGLAVSDTNLTGFADEHLERHVSDDGRKARAINEAIFMILENPLLLAAAPGSIVRDFESFDRALLTQFLMSTDFFGAARQRPERTAYLGYYNQYASACTNPLAELALEA